MNQEINAASRIKRPRRSKDEIRHLKNFILRILEADRPMTIRQLFYQLAAVHQVIDKTEREYENVAVRLTGQLRMDGELPFSWIADNTRWMRKGDSYKGLAEALALTRDTYRRALWSEQDVRVEVWCEKDALAGIIMQATNQWDCPLMVSRGFSSTTFLASAVEQIIEAEKPTFLYYFGDHDPSGIAIDASIKGNLEKISELYRRQGHHVPDIHFQRLAVTRDQIWRWSLPTRPTKTSDSRSRGFEGDSVELDALPKDRLLGLVRNCITQHMDYTLMVRTRQIEQAERDTLSNLVARWPQIEGGLQ